MSRPCLIVCPIRARYHGHGSTVRQKPYRIKAFPRIPHAASPRWHQTAGLNALQRRHSKHALRSHAVARESASARPSHCALLHSAPTMQTTLQRPSFARCRDTVHVAISAARASRRIRAIAGSPPVPPSSTLDRAGKAGGPTDGRCTFLTFPARMRFVF